MKVCGIIAEYDPLHKGHAYHLEQARLRSQADFVICVISCAYSQRGSAAMFSTFDRARMALLSGADLVLGLPFVFGSAQANRFAKGGVGVFQSLGVVTHLSFGVEEALIPFLFQADSLLREADASPVLQESLRSGKSLAMARGDALNTLLKGLPLGTQPYPNLTLALCYLQALRDKESQMIPLPIARQGQYHAKDLSPLPSATAVRAAIRRDDWKALEPSLSPPVFGLIRQCINEGRYHHPQVEDGVLLSHLLQLDTQAAAQTPEISEGLENRIMACAGKASTRDQLVHLIKTKRYPYTRINRALTHLLMGSQAASIPDVPPYARLLGFRQQALPLLSAIKKNGFPLVSKPSKCTHPLINLDMRAESLWALSAGLPASHAYSQQIVMI